MKKQISIFGSTGSIGKNTIEVIRQHQDKFQILALIAQKDVKTLIKQAKEFKPKYVVIENEENFQLLKEALKDIEKCQILSSRNSVLEIAKVKCDLFIAAIVGFAGMEPVINAVKAGSNIALANKESLVCGGEFLIAEAKKNNVKILPVDSEHNAIFQIFENENVANIENIILTASGGPFFNSDKDFKKITVEEALNHPNWNMGKKVTIDSATMMNKGLEIIEAFNLFDIKKDQIDVLVHPESVIHGIVNYNDGSSLSMMSVPDMKVPISYALSYPKRMKINYEKLNLAKLQNLNFFEVDKVKFPSISMAFNCLKYGDNYPIIFNGANEIAVEKFLKKEIAFDKIFKIVEETLNKIPHQKLKNFDEIYYFNELSRKTAKEIIK
jgi:1-deoxy-D-xylulose-5-phosphate reductoisomerase